MKRVALLASLLAGSACAQHDHQTLAPVAPAIAAPSPTSDRPATREWTRQPLLLPSMNRRGERSGAVLQLQGIEANKVTVFAAEGPTARQRVDYAVNAAGTKIESATPRIGNYHWVIARAETPEAIHVASTAWYFGNPGASPKMLLDKVKHELEIIPAPLPREHASYRESDKWRFLVRLNGAPLAQQAVTLETEFGSRSTFITDTAGVATVLFPRDFKPAAQAGAGTPDGHGPRRAKFVLSTEKTDADRRYLTAFNFTYGEDGDRNKSLGWGAAFGLMGMLAATPLLRRRTTATAGEHPYA